MEDNSYATTVPLSFTPAQINNLLAQRLGMNESRGARAKYARRIRKQRSTVTRIISGHIRGRSRRRMAEFLGIPESMMPMKVRTEVA